MLKVNEITNESKVCQQTDNPAFLTSHFDELFHLEPIEKNNSPNE